MATNDCTEFKANSHESLNSAKSRALVNMAAPDSRQAFALASANREQSLIDDFQITDKRSESQPVELIPPDEFQAERKFGSREWAEFVKHHPDVYREMFDQHWRDTMLKSHKESKGRIHPLKMQQNGKLKIESGHETEDKLESFFKEAGKQKSQGDRSSGGTNKYYDLANKKLQAMAERLGFENAELRFGWQQSSADQSGHDAFVEFQKSGKKFILPFDVTGKVKTGKENTVIVRGDQDFSGKNLSETGLNRFLMQIEHYAKKGVVEAPHFYERLLKPSSLTETIELMEKWGKYLKAQQSESAQAEGKRILGESYVHNGDGQDPLRFHKRLKQEIVSLVNRDLLEAELILKEPPSPLPPAASLERTAAPSDTGAGTVNKQRKSPFDGRPETTMSIVAESKINNEVKANHGDRPLTLPELMKRVERRIERLKTEGNSNELPRWTKTLEELRSPETQAKAAEKLNKVIADNRARRTKGSVEAIGGAAAVFIIADYLDHLYEQSKEH